MKESQLDNKTVIATNDYVRMVDENGNSVKIKKDSFMAAIRDALPSIISDGETGGGSVLSIINGALKTRTDANLASVLGEYSNVKDALNSNQFREYNIYRAYNNGVVNAFAIKGIFSWNGVIAYVDVLNAASGMFCERFAIGADSNQGIKRCFSVVDTKNNHCQVYFGTNRVVFKTNGHLLAKVVTNNNATISFEESDVDTTGMTQVTF